MLKILRPPWTKGRAGMDRSVLFNNVMEIMKSKYTLAIFIIAAGIGMFTLIHTVSGQEDRQERAVSRTASDKPWLVRCNKTEEGSEPDKKSGNCEVYQRLLVADTGQRFAEFAIGYPPDREAARGVVVMPLGIMLPPGGQMVIDDSDPFEFEYRYCNQSGCFAYLTLSEPVIDMLKKGNEAAFLIMDTSGKTIRINMSLMGLTRALTEIR